MPGKEHCGWVIIIYHFLQVEDIFNEPDESSTDDEKNRQDDLDDEENIPEDRLLTLETENNSRDR